MRRALSSSVIVLALAPALHAQQAPDVQRRPSEEAQEVRSFALPDTRAARAREASAEGHIAARRWSEAINDLQAMLEDQRGDVLPGTREPKRGGPPSQQPVHVGAAERARERLFELPREAQDLYRDRHENEAGLALASALAHNDRRALSDVARRWPLTRAAERAWWAMGDLELELADVPEALYAWRRALACTLGTAALSLNGLEQWRSVRERFAKSDASASSGILRRIDFAVQFLQEGDSARPGPRADRSETRPMRTASALPPGRDADAWPAPYRLPTHPFPQNGDNLMPARSGDTLLVSTSLRLLALNAYSGTLLWDSEEPPGWNGLSEVERSSFWKGIDRNAAMIAPAASAHVAIAALQIPVAFINNEDFQGTIPITRKLPDRRLFAFDLTTGRKLWDHMPPPLWDGEAGGFIQRMSVAGPPVIVGTRVIAPFHRMQGRIDYHVGCFDVETGALLWSTSLVSGQRELNMFGRPLNEFCAPPVRVVDDRVIALTQLGAVACLDLFTGEIRWETTYEQIPLHANRDFTMIQRMHFWKNAPPAITRDMVVCTPFDSSDLVGLDLATGSMQWSLSHDAINRICATIDSDVELLIGATENTVYLGANKIVALESRSGLHAQVPNVAKWMTPFEDEDMKSSRPGRAVLFGDRILVPTMHKRIDVDAQQGRAIASLPWVDRRGSGEGHGGNLLVGPGEMFTQSGLWVDGYFEWDVLVQRARRAFEQRPTDPRCALELGQLLSNRAEGEWQKGQTENARVHLVDAQSILEKGLLSATGEGAQSLRGELHVVLRRSARVRADLADSAGALQALRSAEGLTSANRDALRDTLLEELAILHNHDTPDRQAAWARALDALERSCADLTLLCELVPGDEQNGANRGLPSHFVPVIGSAAKTDTVPFEMPVGLWVILERANSLAVAGDVPHLFAELHRVLELYADVELPTGSASDLAGDAIGALLSSGRRDGYEVFEARAKTMLDEALKKEDKESLARVTRLFPHSRAAWSASDALLDLAVNAGDAARVLRIVQGELSQRFRMADAGAREVHLCLRIASVFRRAGNMELANELLRTLGEERPDFASDLPEDGARKLGLLARGIPRWVPRETAPPPGQFSTSPDRRSERYGGEQEFLGITYAEPARADAHACAVFGAAIGSRGAVLTAFAETDPKIASWRAELDPGSFRTRVSASYWNRRVAFAAGRVVVAFGDSILGLEAQDGSHVWEWRPPGGAPESISIACAAGVVVAVVHTPDGRYFLQAIDARSGAELWKEGMQDPGVQPLPLLSSNQAVFVPVSGHKQFIVRDLFTGRRAQQFECDVPASYSLDQDAWIEGDRIFLPWFNESRSSARNQAIAIDLMNGRVLWRLGFGNESAERRMLKGILQHGSKTYFLVATLPDASRPSSTPSLLELSPSTGATSPLSNIRLGAEDRILGLSSDSRLRLSSSWIFLLSSARSGARESRLRAVDLESGEQWSQSLRVSLTEIQLVPTPQPALSDSTVAVAFSLVPIPKQALSGGTTQLLFFDRTSGVPRDSQDLDKQLGLSDSLQLIPLGKALLVKGQKRLEIMQ